MEPLLKTLWPELAYVGQIARVGKSQKTTSSCSHTEVAVMPEQSHRPALRCSCVYKEWIGMYCKCDGNVCENRTEQLEDGGDEEDKDDAE